MPLEEKVGVNQKVGHEKGRGGNGHHARRQGGRAQRLGDHIAEVLEGDERSTPTEDDGRCPPQVSLSSYHREATNNSGRDWATTCESARSTK